MARLLRLAPGDRDTRRSRALDPGLRETGLDLDALEAAIAKHSVRALIVTPSFQNPVGSCMTDAARARVVAMMSERDIP